MPLRRVVDRGRTWVVTVGIDKYRHWPELGNAVREVDAIENTLESEFRWKPFISLRNKQATAEAIRSIFTEDLQEVGPQDSVLFYFAGHGIGLAEESGGEFGYLIPEGASYYPIPDQPADPEECVDIWEQIVRPCGDKSCKARAIFLILATCHSGMAFKDTWSDSDALVGKSVQALVAGRPQQQVPDAVRGEELSLFAQALIDGLMGLADTGKLKVITASELIAFAKAEVSFKSRQPNIRFPQDPQGGYLVANASGSEFLFWPVKERLPTPTLLGLRSAESTVRVGALDSLAASDDPVELKVQACATALKDPIPAVRLEAAKVAGRLDSGIALDHLIRTLGSGEQEKEVRKQLVDSVGAIGGRKYISNDAIETLHTTLRSDSEYEVRYRAAKALGTFKYTQENDPGGKLRQSALSVLRSFLNDQDLDVELWTAWALARLDEERGLQRLIDALSDRTKRTARRRQAAINLGELYDQGTRATDALCDAIRQDPDQNVGYLACEALGKTGDERAVPTLVDVLASPVPKTRRYAATALHMIADRLRREGDWDGIKRTRERASETLIRRFTEGSDTAFKGRCAEALGTLREERAISMFREMLKEPYRYPKHVRAAVVWALGVIEGLPSVELVSRFLKDENAGVRRAVLKALITILLDVDPDMHKATLEALRDNLASLDVLSQMALKESDQAARELAKKLLRAILSGESSALC